MLVTQKCQYALRAIYQLAKGHGNGPMKVSGIAKEQAIPPRFLEVILGQLKQGGFIESKRGNEGGYVLAKDPSRLTVGDVIRFVQGPFGPVECIERRPKKTCPLYGACVFLPMWKEVQQAMSAVYDKTTLLSLVERGAAMKGKFIPGYSI